MIKHRSEKFSSSHQWILVQDFSFFHCIACTILVPLPGTESRPLEVEAWSPSQWTAREFPRHFFLSSFFFFFLFLLIFKSFLNLFLTMLGLCCCRLFCSGSNRGILSSWGAQTSHCSGFSRGRTWAVGCVDFSSCSSWALEHRLDSCSTCGMGDLLGSGIEHVSPVLVGRFFTTEPPGKPPRLLKEKGMSSGGR